MYVYLHTNGQYIKKTDWPVDSMGASEYFEGPFIVKYWHFNSEAEADKFIEEAKHDKISN